MKKKKILEAIEKLPEDASYSDVWEELTKLRQIELGMGPDEWFVGKEIIEETERKWQAKHAKKRNQWLLNLSKEGIEAEWKRLAEKHPTNTITKIKEQVQRNRIRANGEKENKASATISLWRAAGFGLIIPLPSGAIYTNQTGGTSCHHPEIEGVYVPLVDEQIDQEKKLFEFFTGSKWRGSCANGIDLETARVVDQILQESEETRMLSVDRDCLYVSEEAWIYVNIDEKKQDPRLPTFEGNELGWGIITWENSD